MLIGGAVGVVVILIIVVVAVVATSGSGKKKVTTTPGSTPSASTSPSSPSSTTGGGSSQPSLLSLVPSAFQSTCMDQGTTGLDPGANADVVCQTASVPAVGASIVVYERFDTQGAEAQDYQGFLSDNGVTQGQGDCSQVSLTGTATNGMYCEDTYTADSSSNKGNEVIFVGSDFKLGGGTAAQACQAANRGDGSGVTVLLFTSAMPVAGTAVIACSTNSAYASSIHQNFLNGTYGLNG